MKKRTVYLLLLLVFLGGTAFVVLRYNRQLKSKENAFYALRERNAAGAQAAEWETVKTNAAKLIRIVRENPQDTKSALALATLYIQEGRITGNQAYYDEAGMHYLDVVLVREPENFQALVLKALVQLSQHHFAEGLATAQQAQKINPYNAFPYGLMVDAYVELGDYKAAVESSEKMASIRPDIRSYTRIAYLREIHGDYPGAIEAMQMAADAGPGGDEPTEWARVQLGRLYENGGDLKKADLQYRTALAGRPDYAYALAGLAHLALASKNYKEALALYEQADKNIGDNSFKEEWAKAYIESGDRQKGEALLRDMIDETAAAAKKGEGSTDISHHAGMELAYAYLLLNEPGKALPYATTEYNRRPDNIDVNEAMAWVYYKKGDVKKALPHLNTALRTGSKNPALLCRAGLIYTKAGDKSKAKTMLGEALKLNPTIDAELKRESEAVLQTL